MLLTHRVAASTELWITVRNASDRHTHRQK